MLYRTISKNSYYRRVNYTIELPIPLFGQPGVDSERDELNHEIVETVLYSQYRRAMNRAIDSYINSGLPEKFLSKQEVVITHLCDAGINGFYSPFGDLIGIDCDGLCISRYGKNGDWIYGHENGHRILCHTTRSPYLESVCRILDISDTRIAEEVLCDAFGNLVSGLNYNLIPYSDLTINYEKIQAIKNMALQVAWSI